MLYKQLLPCVCIHTHRRIACQPPTYTRTELTSWITLSTDQAHPAFLSKCSGPAWLPWHDLFNGSCLGVCRVSKSFMIVLLPRHALLHPKGCLLTDPHLMPTLNLSEEAGSCISIFKVAGVAFTSYSTVSLSTRHNFSFSPPSLPTVTC